VISEEVAVVAAVFAQMWVLCLVSFVLGALVTWLAVGPARRRAQSVAPPEPAVVLDPVQAAQAPPTPLPGVPRHARTSPANPALAELDRTRGRRAAASAVGALDRLRHPEPHPRIHPEPHPRIPPQAGPQDRRPGGLFTPPEPPEVPPRRTPGPGE
jgi:hypothetical protein